jgi:hypothetical protein
VGCWKHPLGSAGIRSARLTTISSSLSRRFDFELWILTIPLMLRLGRLRCHGGGMIDYFSLSFGVAIGSGQGRAWRQGRCMGRQAQERPPVWFPTSSGARVAPNGQDQKLQARLASHAGYTDIMAHAARVFVGSEDSILILMVYFTTAARRILAWMAISCEWALYDRMDCNVYPIVR